MNSHELFATETDATNLLPQERLEIVFLDASVADGGSLLSGIPPSMQIVRLEGDSDGVLQIAAALSGKTGVNAVHIVSHGHTGSLRLGTATLSLETLNEYADSLEIIGQALSEDGDILLYGCNVAGGEAGAAFVDALALATGADVAASDGPTGAAELGGNWLLEARTGPIAAAPFSSAEALAGYAGLLDDNTAPTFLLGDGSVVTDLGGSDYGRSLAVQADGKIVLAGYSNGNFGIARFSAEGALDESFGDGGRVVTDFDAADYGYGVAIQADGKIVVAGSSGDDFALARYNTDGSLDSDFGDGGRVWTDFGDFEQGLSLTIQVDGKIVVAGASEADFAIARYKTDGSLDTEFDGDGQVVTDLGGWDTAHSVTVLADGDILVAGYGGAGDGDFAIARYNGDGSLDTGFGDNGIVTTDFGGWDVGYGVMILEDGDFVVAGSSYQFGGGGSNFALARYNPNGSLDEGFGTDGLILTDFGNYDIAQSVTEQDGKILAVGYSGGAEFALARYNADGSLDEAFGSGGQRITDLGGADYARAVTVLGDGDFLVAGSTSSYGGGNFALVRYNADGTPDTGFGAVDTLGGVTTFLTTGEPVVLDSDVRIFDAELEATGSYAGAVLTLARHGGANPDDQFSPTGTIGVIGDLAGGIVTLEEVEIGTYTQEGGIGTIVFNDAATPERVNAALRQIAYSNTSASPPDSVQIDWTFSDGSGASALSTIGSTTVQIVFDDFAADPSTVASVAVGSPAIGDIEASGDQDWFRVTLEAGIQYRIDLEGSPTGQGSLGDSYLRGIYNSAGTPIPGTSDDDGGVGTNSQVLFTPTASGTYYIAASGYRDEIGTYRLSVTRVLSAADDTFSLDEDSSASLDVLANDTDPNGNPLTVTGVTTAPSHGTAMVEDDGTITYTPDVDFSGTDSFIYAISDGHGGSDTATVTLTVNQQPEAISLAGNFVESGVAGYTVGAIILPPSDPPPTMSIDDARFEIVGGVLKLKAGQFLQAETAAVVPVVITATDSLG